MAYTYEKQLWKDYPDTTTPITSDRLNHMEDGIKGLSDAQVSIEVIDSLDGNSTTNAPSIRAVNDGLLDKYSTEEQRIGTWIDGKKIYRKVINIGPLKSTQGAFSYNHGISNIAYFTKVEGIINNGTEWFTANSVYRGVNNYTYDFGLLATKTKITFSTQTDRSAYSAIVTLEYTKTTD